MKLHNRYKVLTIILTITVLNCGWCIYNQHQQIVKIQSDLQNVQAQCDENILLYNEFYDISEDINKISKNVDKVVKEKEKEKRIIQLNDPRTLIKLACKETGVDPVLAIAISRAETGNWTSDLYKANNNVGGMTDGNEWFSYSTLLQGVNAYVINLKNNYIDLGLTTPETIGGKYCPEGTTNWIALVNEIMVEERNK